MMREFVVTRQEAGGRFDKYLKRLLPEASSGFLYKMLRKKNITLNDKKAEGKELLAEKDVVKLFFSEETFLKFAGRAGGCFGQDRMEKPVIYSGQDAERERKEHSGQRAEKDSLRRYSGPKFGIEYQEAFHQLGMIPVIYEDEDILILNKPAGVLSQKAERGDFSANEWMIGYLLHKGEITEEELMRFRPSVCNRLDRNTSGLLLCGKTLRGSRFLSEILRDRSLHKYYLTYVKGKVEHPIVLKGYLKKDKEKNRSVVLSEEEYRKQTLKAEAEEYQKRNSKSDRPEKRYEKKAGRENTYQHRAWNVETGEKFQKIETVIEPLSYCRDRDCTKLEILLVTGKSHQIRAHLAGIGHPVLGDIKYGWKSEKKQDLAWADIGLQYQLLHAYRVEFPEIEGEFGYLSGKTVTAPMPELFRKMEEKGGDI